jgi:pilus assembly protein CpaF
MTMLDARTPDGAPATGADGIVDDVVFAQLRQQVEAELAGAGPLERLLAQDGVTDVVVNAPDAVWIDRGAGMERSAVGFAGEAEVRRLACRLAAAAGRRLDDAQPFVDAVLPDGTRLHALLPPLVEHTAVSLRVLGRRTWDVAGLLEPQPRGREIVALLEDVVRRRLSFVVSGGTGSGKTTLLGALLGQADAGERLLLIEDTPELLVRHPHVVRLVPRPANIEGAGAVPARELVRQALRMRPDRLVVGEFRGAEFVELLVALNTGHRGGGATLHANSAAQVPARLHALGALAGLSSAALTALTAPAIDVVIHLERTRAGRQVAEVARLVDHDGRLLTESVWTSAAGRCGQWS